MKTFCLYHNPCNDGFGAAWALREALAVKRRTIVTFVPADYSYDFSIVAMHDATVYLVDYSLPLDLLLELSEVAKRVVIIDHHKTAMKLLDTVLPDNVELNFSEEHSGAVMVWQYFFPETETPTFLELIEDRDLWLFKHDNTNAFYEGSQLLDRNFNNWDEFKDAKFVADTIDQGRTILQYKEQKIYEIIKSNFQMLEVLDIVVPVLNCPAVWASDLSALLCEDYPYVATYHVTKTGKLKFSLRCAKDSPWDMSGIAECYGGGGHKNAAGFYVQSIEALNYWVSKRGE